MLVSAHVLTGALIGKSLKKPLYIIPSALASHYVLDYIPHWHSVILPNPLQIKDYIFIVFDILIAMIVLFLVLKRNNKFKIPIFLGVSFAIVQDFDFFSIYFPEILDNFVINTIWKFHSSIQHETISLLGLIPQIFLAFFAFYFLFRHIDK